jgi:N-acetylmuramoyl-L-alanine amidase CwlA
MYGLFRRVGGFVFFYINDILQELEMSMNKSCTEFKKIRNKYRVITNAWFSPDCRQAKRKSQTLLKDFRKRKFNVTLNVYLDSKRIYRNLCKHKHWYYTQNIYLK